MKITLDGLKRGEHTLAVVGLGYVGLPLAAHFARHFKTVGFDIDHTKIQELRQGRDRTGEVTPEDLRQRNLQFSSDPSDLGSCSVIIVAVPTPVDDQKRPDLTPLRLASETIGQWMTSDTIVIFESTVYPGVTEGLCRDLLETRSGFKLGEDYYLGYSPERINPGDKEHTLDKIKKVVSGCCPQSTALIADLYRTVVTAGVFEARDIKTAEAAKVIENTQRDLNIALMNELAVIFSKLGLDTQSVLAAARTKWNFLPFTPGLVGGHCIGVDPYYLTSAAQAVGYDPQVILAGRRINDGMGSFIAQQTLDRLNKQPGRQRILVLGLTFKENVPDLRNSKVIDIIGHLSNAGIQVLVHDPMVTSQGARDAYGIELVDLDDVADVDAIIIAVAHHAYFQLSDADLAGMAADNAIVVDVKGIRDPEQLLAQGLRYWRL